MMIRGIEGRNGSGCLVSDAGIDASVWHNGGVGIRSEDFAIRCK
jgi:hypothetical protein